jgi:hypothetical protein
MMWGNFAFHVVRGDFRLCADLAEQGDGFGERFNDPGILMEALFLRGITMLYRGDFPGAREACARSIADYDDRARTAYWAGLIGEDAGVTNAVTSPWRCGISVILIRRWNSTARPCSGARHQPPVQPRVRLASQRLAAAALPARRSRPTGRRRGDSDCDRTGLSVLARLGTLFHAPDCLLQGRVDEALGLLEKGFDAYRATGAELALTLLPQPARRCLHSGG